MSKYGKGHPSRRYSNGWQDEQCKSEVGRSRAEAGTATPPENDQGKTRDCGSIAEGREYGSGGGGSVRGASQSDRKVASFVSEWATWECAGTTDTGGAHRRRGGAEEEKPRVESATESSGSHSHRVRASASQH